MSVSSDIFVTTNKSLSVWQQYPGNPKPTLEIIPPESIVIRLNHKEIRGFSGKIIFGIFLLPCGSSGLLELRYVKPLLDDN